MQPCHKQTAVLLDFVTEHVSFYLRLECLISGKCIPAHNRGRIFRKVEDTVSHDGIESFVVEATIYSGASQMLTARWLANHRGSTRNFGLLTVYTQETSAIEQEPSAIPVSAWNHFAGYDFSANAPFNLILD